MDTCTVVIKILVVLFVMTCQPPSCTSTAVKSSIHVKEEMPEGTFIVNLAKLFNAKNSGLPYRNLEYKLLSQKLKAPASMRKRTSALSWVKLNSRNGVMTTSRKIDRDTECPGADKCVVYIQAVMLPQSAFTLLDLELIIDDVNDNPPTFEQGAIQISISESWSTGDVYSLDAYQAKDKDTGNNSRLYYELSPNPFFGLKQYIGTGGVSHLQLYLLQDLDYEKYPEIKLTLTAIDGGRPAMKSKIPIKIQVIDVNDNMPEFEREEYFITLRENLPPGNVIETVKAYDKDSESYGQIRYSIPRRNSVTARSLLLVDENTGILTLNERVDGEKHDGIRILIEARDNDPVNPRTGECWVVISVEDVNDNEPVINAIPILNSDGDSIYVSELAPVGTYVMRVSAVDEDKGRNGEVHLEIKTNALGGCRRRASRTGSLQTSKVFVLSADGLVATGRSLDRESCGEYILTLKACDFGSPNRCSEKTLSVVVLDENEYAPRFQAPTQRVTVSEDVPGGTIITTVRAYDGDNVNGRSLVLSKAPLAQAGRALDVERKKIKNGDVIEGENGKVKYYITSGGRGFFTIDSEAGTIRLLRPLDREEKKNWMLTITAQDGAKPKSLESVCRVIITVEDVNDNTPQFTNPAINNTLVYASISRDDVVVKLNAKDRDSGRNSHLRYKIISENTNDLVSKSATSQVNNNVNQSSGNFVLNALTGELRLNFSRKNMSDLVGIHGITIRVSDMGDTQLSSNISLRIKVSESMLDNWKSRASPEGTTFTVNFLVLAVSLGSATVILMVVIIAIAIRCQRENEEVEMFNTPKHDQYDFEKQESRDDDISMIPDYNFAPAPAISVNSEVLSSNGSQSTLKVASPSASNLTAKMVDCDDVTPNNDPNHLSVSQNFESGANCHSDGDSGRGDSDVDVTSNNQTKDAVKSKHQNVTQTVCGMGPFCDHQCKELGHSDNCWMPRSGAYTNVVPARQTSATTKENAMSISKPANHLRRYSSNDSCLNDRPCLSKPRSRQPLHAINSNARELYDPSCYLPPTEITYAASKQPPHIQQFRYERSLSCRSTPTNLEPESFSSATCTRYYAKNSSRNDMYFNRGSVTNLSTVHETPFSLRNDNLFRQNPSPCDLKGDGDGSACKNVRFAPSHAIEIKDQNAESISQEHTDNNVASQQANVRCPVASPMNNCSNTILSAGSRYSMQETCDIINDIDRLLF